MFLLLFWVGFFSFSHHEIGDVLRQSWFISLWPPCPCLLIFLLPELVMSPLYSNQVAFATPACWLGVREEEEAAVVRNGATHLCPTEASYLLVFMSVL